MEMPIADNTFDAAYVSHHAMHRMRYRQHAMHLMRYVSHHTSVQSTVEIIAKIGLQTLTSRDFANFSAQFQFSHGTVLLSMYLPPLVLQRGAYSEVYRVLKPGQYFALDEWCMTDRFDPNNGKHLSIKADIELGNGLPDIRTTHQCVQAMKDAGFEVLSLYQYTQAMSLLPTMFQVKLFS
jgi:sterol 24-C-methyltransferase